MSDGESLPLDDWLGCWPQQEASREAFCRKLLDRTYDRLAGLARTIFHEELWGKDVPPLAAPLLERLVPASVFREMCAAPPAAATPRGGMPFSTCRLPNPSAFR
jgi:hypothetical protein